jgi:hypothetical protein
MDDILYCLGGLFLLVLPILFIRARLVERQLSKGGGYIQILGWKPPEDAYPDLTFEPPPPLPKLTSEQTEKMIQWVTEGHEW